jgi:hypothetical protein
MDRNAEILGKVLGGICGESVVETGQEKGIVQWTGAPTRDSLKSAISADY